MFHHFLVASCRITPFRELGKSFLKTAKADMAMENDRLRETATRMRSKAMRSQIALGFTFCKLAETELQLGEFRQRDILMQKMRRVTQTVRRHLAEPNYIPPGEVEELRSEIARLESRILDVEKRRG